MSTSTVSPAPTTTVRTRIAPSPTGFLHLGTARTALYSWAYARHHGGQFILRIEDTDVARSTQESTDQILESMRWLGLDADEGPIYQMQRLDRYRAVAEDLIARGLAYRCWTTPAELDRIRDEQRARGEKTHYDGRWRPAPGKTLPPIPDGVVPVIRFAMPADGDAQWSDLVKGEMRIGNREFDDLVIVRGDGIPTYNFAVVVDDIDMRITHVFRGDEHVNNTPWQIAIFRALGAQPPQFGHCPIILGDDGQKLSKRRGAVSVTAYEDAGYLPEAMLNYLARLGWSHGDMELFSREQMVQWFDGSHLSKSPAQWDPAKLAWVNAQYLKQADPQRLEALLAGQLQRRGVAPPASSVAQPLIALFKDRCNTVADLADWAQVLQTPPVIPETLAAAHFTPPVLEAFATLRRELAAIAPADWNKASIAQALKATLAAHAMKMPQLAPAVRVRLCGRAETPSIDAVLALAAQDDVLRRLDGV